MGEGTKAGGSTRITEIATGGVPALHDGNGKFAPGNHAGGRKPKSVEQAYLQALKNAMPPEEVEQLIRDGLAIAKESKSWRGIAEMVQLAMQYGAGKPVNRLPTSDGNLAQLLEALGRQQIGDDNTQYHKLSGGQAAETPGEIVDGEIKVEKE